MIVFRGAVNNNTLKYIYNKMMRLGAIAILSEFIILGFPSILVGILFETWLFFILLTFVFLPITFLMAWSTRKDQLPYLIRIDEIEI